MKQDLKEWAKPYFPNSKKALLNSKENLELIEACLE